MRYLVHMEVVHAVPEIEISADEFASLKAARLVLSNAFAIEEKYEIVISNFLDLEKRLLDIAATNTVRDTLSYAEFFETRSALNVRLVNLLTATRLYLDQLSQHICECVPNGSEAGELVKAKRSEEYDKYFEYRFMEALRNHVQHRGIPVHYIRQNGHWTSFEEDGLMEFSVYIAAQRAFLEEDEKFKKTILNEASDDVDLVATSRRYIESLSAINELVRNLIADYVNSARGAIEATHRNYARVYSGNLMGLSAFEMGDDQVVSSVPLLLDWDDVRIQLQQRNKQLVNLARRYVTSRVTLP
jgi:hypothetical protein